MGKESSNTQAGTARPKAHNVSRSPQEIAAAQRQVAKVKRQKKAA